MKEHLANGFPPRLTMAVLGRVCLQAMERARERKFPNYLNVLLFQVQEVAKPKLIADLASRPQENSEIANGSPPTALVKLDPVNQRPIPTMESTIPTLAQLIAENVSIANNVSKLLLVKRKVANGFLGIATMIALEHVQQNATVPMMDLKSSTRICVLNLKVLLSR